jgi:hypothetical protein
VRKLYLLLSFPAVLLVWIADLLLQGLPAVREGWWTLAFFAFPAALLVLALDAKERSKLQVAAWAVFVLGIGGYVGYRFFFGKIEGTPAVAAGDKAPNFTLKDAEGRNVELAELRKFGHVALVFFRGPG